MSSSQEEAAARADEEAAQACVHAMQLGRAGVLPMVLRAAIELDVVEIIARAGPGARLSPAEVAAELPTANPDAPAMLDRILRFLASHSILTRTVGGVEGGETSSGARYGLAPVCKYLARNQEGISLAPLVLFGLDRAFMDSWYNLRDAVLHGGVPFHRAHGVAVYEYRQRNDGFRELFDAASAGNTTLVVQRMLETYPGFDRLEGGVVVDVAGGAGAAIGMIVSRHPGIRGVNFDLPHVVDKAPAYPGVEHVGGDMFASVPKGDAMFIKGVLHNWSDEKCLEVLRNCWEALPEFGKVISMEAVLPAAAAENTKQAQLGFDMDLIMLAHFAGGKVRKQEEYEALAMAAGFTRFRIACYAFSEAVMEFFK